MAQSIESVSHCGASRGMSSESGSVPKVGLSIFLPFLIIIIQNLLPLRLRELLGRIERRIIRSREIQTVLLPVHRPVLSSRDPILLIIIEAAARPCFLLAHSTPPLPFHPLLQAYSQSERSTSQLPIQDALEALGPLSSLRNLLHHLHLNLHLNHVTASFLLLSVALNWRNSLCEEYQLDTRVFWVKIQDHQVLLNLQY